MERGRKNRAAILSRKEEIGSRFERARRKERAAGRLAMTILFGGLAFLSFFWDRWFELSWVWGALGWLAILLAAYFRREQLTKRRLRLGFALQWLERRLRRVDGKVGFGQEDGTEYRDPAHLYSGDLDLFGPDSLFHRLNACHTVSGRDELARFLKGAPAGSGLAERREAVAELVSQAGFREALEVEFRCVRAAGGRDPVTRALLDAETRTLAAWTEDDDLPRFGKGSLVLAWTLMVLASAALVLKFLLPLPWNVCLPFYLANFWLLLRIPGMERILNRFERVRRTLKAWSEVFRLLEGGDFSSSILRGEAERLGAGGFRASREIVRLDTLVSRLSQRRNPAWFFTIDILWLLDLHVLRALAHWKRTRGPFLAGWFQAVSRFEALASLAAYAESVPEETKLEEQPEGPMLLAEEVAHPLLPPAERVGNDILLEEAGTVLLVTGSNMSGKSTFIRAIGASLVLGRLGLPVPAKRFQVRCPELATCMRVEDSLARGDSLFHAEVCRLKECLDIAERRPGTLVLLDEVLSGTNFQDRHTGTLAVLRSLVDRKAVVLLSTHDLELAALAREDPARYRVVHFQDFLEAGRMAFDYRLRPGPLDGSNALEVMRQAGIRVGES